jgi:hypothetical protein
LESCRLRRCFNGLSWRRRRALSQTSVLQSPDCETRCCLQSALSRGRRSVSARVRFLRFLRPTSARSSSKVGGGGSSSGKRRRLPGAVPHAVGTGPASATMDGSGSRGGSVGARPPGTRATQCCRLTELEKQIEIGQAELQINQGALDDLRVRVLLFALVGPAPRTSGATTAAGLCSNECRLQKSLEGDRDQASQTALAQAALPHDLTALDESSFWLRYWLFAGSAATKGAGAASNQDRCEAG